MKIDEYLKTSDRHYFVSDKNLDKARIIIFEAYPTAMDIRAGESVSALKAWDGADMSGEVEGLDVSDVGTVYISNVPLYPTDSETGELVSELEGLRLSARVENDYLREQFNIKMKKIINNESIRLVSYKLEIFKRYYDDFLVTAERELIERLKARVESGALKIIGFPRYTLEQIRKFERRYNDFVSAVANVISD